jgi:hypothetical protein
MLKCIRRPISLLKKESKMFKIRFHLGAGENFGKWQIKKPDGTVEYVDPEMHDILMWKGTLKNRKATAQKILDGAHKAVCAWIECEDYNICQNMSMPNYWGEIKFNPKKCNHWTNEQYGDLDGKTYTIIYSYGKQLRAKGIDF